MTIAPEPYADLLPFLNVVDVARSLAFHEGVLGLSRRNVSEHDGKIVHADGDRLTVKTGDNTRITVDRGRVAAMLDVKGEPKEE